jgi:hypothetical protein
MSVNRLKGTLNADGSSSLSPTRSGPYLEAYTLPVGGGLINAADEGSYFHASNATLATGIAGHAAPVVADTSTKALLHLYNGGSKNIIPDYLFLEVTAAGTAGTIHYTTIYLDDKGSTARSSGGTAITPVNCNGGASGVSTSATVYFGAVVTAMDAAAVKVGQQIVREVIPVVQDTILMKFGPVSGAQHSALATSGTGTNHCVQCFAPIVVPPGGNLVIAQIRPDQTAASSYQFSFGYIER